MKMETKRFVYVSYIKTTPEKLWKALTDGTFIRQYWYGHNAESDWEQGSPITFFESNGRVNLKGRVLKSDPPRFLSYTFQPEWEEEWKGQPPSKVTFELALERQLVKLTLTHDEFAAGTTVFEDVSRGWPVILCSLKSLLETGEALVYQQ